MQKFTLIRYLKTSDLDFKFKKVVQLPGTPAIENGVQLTDGTFLLVRCLTFCEDGRIFVLVSDDHSIQDNDINERIKEYEADGWACSSHEDSNQQ